MLHGVQLDRQIHGESGANSRRVGEPFEVLLSDPMIAVQLRSVDAEELQQILKFSLAVMRRRHHAVCRCPLATSAGSSR